MVAMAEIVGLVWLCGYIALNLLTTVLNKSLFQTYKWPYPLTLALWHYTTTAIGSLLVVRVFKMVEPAKLDMTAHRKLFLFSILFNVNILISAVSLHMVSMALHQIIRALVPAFTVVIMLVWERKHYPPEILFSLAVIFAGVTIYAMKGEVDYTIFGLLLTLSGAFLAALKGVVTNVFMVGPLKLHPLDLIQYMASYAALQMVVVLLMTGELFQSLGQLMDGKDSVLPMVFLLNGAGAFALNVVSFNANKKTSPLAMNIGGIAKQVLAIIFGIVIFGVTVTSTSAIGITITVAGIVAYAMCSFRNRQKATEAIKRAEASDSDAAAKV